jgi:predicted GH43/DUF377 family glycosyl hydrolase
MMSLLAVLVIAAEPFPPELVRFRSVQDQPVFRAAEAPAWDRRIRERGWILREPDGWKLWYTGYDGSADGRRMLGLATSADGLNWKRHPNNPLLAAIWVEDMCVVRDGDRYLMVAEGEEDRAQWFTSADGVTWKHQGRLDVRLTTGQPIPDGPYGTPTLYRDGTSWCLFYERSDLGVWLAKSTDLKTWTNVSDEPVLTPGPADYDRDLIAINQVIRYEGRHYAFYHGSARSGPTAKLWSTAVAVSDNLKNWTKYPGNPLIPTAKNRSSGMVVPLGERRFRLYTTHPEVYVAESAP